MSDTTRGASTLSADDRAFLRDLMMRRSGIALNVDRDAMLTSRLLPLARRFDLDGLPGLVAQLRAGDAQAERSTIEALTTHETSFFRDQLVFEDIANVVVPRLVQQAGADGNVTVWFAACSAGQEVYSLAMCIDQSAPQLIDEGRLRLLATDLCPGLVDRCRDGLYSDLEVRRGLPEAMISTYFERRDDGWRAIDRLRNLIRGRELNLVGPLKAVPRCDLVLMRNVLIYFDEATKTSILASVRQSVLRPNGVLMLGGSEMIGGASDRYQRVQLPNCTAYTPRQ